VVVIASSGRIDRLVHSVGTNFQPTIGMVLQGHHEEECLRLPDPNGQGPTAMLADTVSLGGPSS